MTKRIAIVLLAMFIIFSFSQICNAKDNIPAGSASETVVKKWITNSKNKDQLKKVGISKYISWYKNAKENSTTRMAIINAIEENKDANQVKEFVYSKVEVKETKDGKISKNIDATKLNDVPEEILRVLWRISGKAGDTVTEGIIKKAVDPDGENPESVVPDLKDPTGSDLETRAEYAPNLRTIDSEKISGVVGPIITIITDFGMIISVITLMVIGIKYMLGSAEERADYKNTLKPYVIGAVLLFGGSAIPQFIYKAIIYSPV